MGYGRYGHVGPSEYILAASAARTANPTLAPAAFDNDPGQCGVVVVVNITSAGTGSINCFVEGYDPASAAYFTILDSGALTTNQTKVLTVYPHVTDAANSKAGQALTKRWRVRINHNNANSITYSVGAVLLP